MGEQWKALDLALQPLPLIREDEDANKKATGKRISGGSEEGTWRTEEYGVMDVEERRIRERKVREMMTPAELRLFDRVMLRLDCEELGNVDEFVQAAMPRLMESSVCEGASSSELGLENKTGSEERGETGREEKGGGAAASASAWLRRVHAAASSSSSSTVVVVEESCGSVVDKGVKKKRRGWMKKAVGCVKKVVGAGVRAVGDYFEETATDEALDEAEFGNPRRRRLAMELALAERKARGLPPPPDLPQLHPQQPGWLWRMSLGLTMTAAAAVLGNRGGLRFCVKSPFPDVRERDRVVRRIWPPRPRRGVILLGGGKAAQLMGYDSVVDATDRASVASEPSSHYESLASSPSGSGRESDDVEVSPEAHQFIEQILADAFADRDSDDEGEYQEENRATSVQATSGKGDGRRGSGGPFPAGRRKT